MVLTLPPAFYSDTHASRLSDKYVHVKTSEVLDVFQDHGWKISAASSANRGKNQQHSRHLVRMRHSDYLEGFRADGVIPELLVLNSHNGSWALRMMLGMFRTVCANGMVAGSVWEGVTLKHYRLKDLEAKVQSATVSMSDHVHTLGNCIETWDKIELSAPQQEEFATKAREIRWGAATPVEASVLLEARRPEDTGTSLWKVFNRVQESLTQGGFSGRTSNNHIMSVKGVKNVRRDFMYNKRLWELADNLSKEATA